METILENSDDFNRSVINTTLGRVQQFGKEDEQLVPQHRVRRFVQSHQITE
jgi:hypothetical protein